MREVLIWPDTTAAEVVALLGSPQGFLAVLGAEVTVLARDLSLAACIFPGTRLWMV